MSLVALRQVSSQVNALKASSSGDKPTGILVNYGPKTHFSLIYPLRVVKQYIKENTTLEITYRPTNSIK